jgi:hypothetical protein
MTAQITLLPMRKERNVTSSSPTAQILLYSEQAARGRRLRIAQSESENSVLDNPKSLPVEGYDSGFASSGSASLQESDWLYALAEARAGKN